MINGGAGGFQIELKRVEEGQPIADWAKIAGNTADRSCRSGRKSRKIFNQINK